MNKMTKSQAEAKVDRLYAKALHYAKYEDIGGPEYGPDVVISGWSTKGYRIIRRAERIENRYNVGFPNY